MPEHVVDFPDCGCWGCIEIHSVARDSLGLLAKERERVDLLTVEDLSAVSAPVEMPLLEQLQQAVYEKGSERGVSGASRSGVPVDLVGLELLESIGRELHWDAISLLARDVDSRQEPVADALALLGRVDTLPYEVLLPRVEGWRRWVEQIRAYLAPERRTPIPGRCPAEGCGQEVWFTYDEDGDRISAPALVALWEGEQVASVMCSCCLTLWPRHRLWELAQALDPTLGPRLLAQGR